MKSFRVFFIPFLLLLTAWVIDKIFVLGNFPFYYLTTGSFVNFEQKEKLVYELKQYLNQSKRKKVLVILGNSRSMSFDNHYIQKKFPDWILFNFSVPGGTQDYYLYIIEKFKKLNIKPNAVIFAVTPQGMNATPSVLTDEVMVFGLPFEFILKYFYLYRLDELTNYIGKQLSVVYRYRPKLKVIENRINDANLIKFVDFIINTHRVLEENQGNVPINEEYKAPSNEEFIQQNANSIWKDFFIPFHLNQNSIVFIKKCIDVSKELNIEKIYLLWPPVSAYLLEKKKSEKVAYIDKNKPDKKTVVEVWYPAMLEIVNTYHIKWLDFNIKDPLKCNYYYDASHLASICYSEYTDKIFYQLEGK